MKKAALVIPPLCDFYFTYHRFSCLGAEIVRKILENHNIKVDYFNFPLMEKRKTNLPLELEYLKKYIIPEETGPLGFFTQYKYYGPDLNKCISLVLATKPDIIFLSCFAFCYAEETRRFALKIKEKTDIPVAAGGAGISVYPMYFLNENAVDFCFTGEAEVSLPLFIKEYSGSKNYKKIPGFLCKANDTEIRKYTDSSNLEFSVKKSYETKKAVYYSTHLSRGCPKKCSFCTIHLNQGRIFRTMPLEIIENEIKYFTKPEKMVFINFEDDNIMLNPEYFFNVLKLFRKYLNKPFFLLENGIDYNLLNSDYLDTLIRLGIKKLNISLASKDKSVLKAENRKLDLSKYEKILNEADKNNIPVTTYFICGFKTDSKKSTAETLAYLFNRKTELGISLFYAVPGLKDFNKKSDFKNPSLCAGSSAYPWNNSLNTRTLTTAFRLSRFINCFKRNNEEDKHIIAKILKDKALYTYVRNRKQIKVIPVENIDKELVKFFFKNIQ